LNEQPTKKLNIIMDHTCLKSRTKNYKIKNGTNNLTDLKKSYNVLFKEKQFTE